MIVVAEINYNTYSEMYICDKYPTTKTWHEVNNLSSNLTYVARVKFNYYTLQVKHIQFFF